MGYLRLAMALASAALVMWAAHWLYQAGKNAATVTITKANDKAENAADAAERCVLAGKWNKEAGKCEP